MSDNPFLDPTGDQQSPIQPSPSYAQPVNQTKPSWWTFILVITLILSLFGLLANVLVIASPFVNQFFEGLQVEQDLTEAQKQAQEELKKIQASDFIPNLLFALMNFIVAPMLLIGAIGGFGRKSWSANLLRIGFLMAIVFNVLRIAYTLITQIGSMENVKELTIKSLGDEGAQAAGLVGPMIWGVLIFSLFLSLLMIAFYFFGLKKVTSPAVKAYLGVTE